MSKVLKRVPSSNVTHSEGLVKELDSMLKSYESSPAFRNLKKHFLHLATPTVRKKRSVVSKRRE
jgi:hypothetical protein